MERPLDEMPNVGRMTTAQKLEYRTIPQDQSRSGHAAVQA